jgi:hypothetical protein
MSATGVSRQVGRREDKRAVATGALQSTGQVQRLLFKALCAGIRKVVVLNRYGTKSFWLAIGMFATCLGGGAGVGASASQNCGI